LIAWADVAISAGGSTCWELAYLGTPFIALVNADNQKPVVFGIAAHKAAINMGSGQTITPKKISTRLKIIIGSMDMRTDLSKNSKNLVDGEGISRLIMKINAHPVRLRIVKQSDCKTLWYWVNDPIVRKCSFNSEHIPIEEHKLWFSQKINDPNCYFFIGLDEDDNPVGQIRFDTTGDTATVDISIDKKRRGKGYAKYLLNLGIVNLIKRSNVTLIKAYIIKENLNSIKTFKSCEFGYPENKIMKNRETVVLSRKIL
jgi:RimJ/RimL family protein N-acetyltransferase